MRKKLSLLFKTFLMLAVFTMGGTGCQKTVEQKIELYPGKITIGVVVWPGYGALHVAQDKGFFKEAGLDVEIKLYTSQAECSRDFVAGKLQGRANLTNEAVNEALQGMVHKIVLIIDYSNGSDGIIAQNDIKNLSQAKGRKVAFEFGTLEEYFIQYALDQNGMSLQDIVPVNLDPENAAKAMTQGTVDVGVTYEPYLSAAIKNGGSNLVYSSADAPGLITDILTFRADFIREHPESIAAIVKVYFKALKFWQDNPDEANAIIGKKFGNTKEEIAEQLKGVTLLGEKENKAAMSFAVGTQSIYGNLRKVGDFVLKHQEKKGLVLDTDLLVDKSFVKKLGK